jgi:hypothetical protein
MNHNILKQVILEQIETIQNAEIIETVLVISI